MTWLPEHSVLHMNRSLKSQIWKELARRLMIWQSSRAYQAAYLQRLSPMITSIARSTSLVKLRPCKNSSGKPAHLAAYTRWWWIKTTAVNSWLISIFQLWFMTWWFSKYPCCESKSAVLCRVSLSNGMAFRQLLAAVIPPPALPPFPDHWTST